VISLPEPIASPLPFIFAEDKHGDRQAREALFCTFNADLGYFERTVLGVTQSAGARVTVVGDGRMSDPDPRAARNAGTRYVHGLAVTKAGAAFHPKVTVITGPERAMVAVGSGNLSPGGWHLNQETWTIATASREHCPAIVPQVAAWLRTLPDASVIAPQAVRGIGRTATLLERLAATAAVVETGHRIVHTSTAPIISQLPGGDVDRLLLYAPFHDEKGAAVRQLIERMRPGRVTLAVQSDGRTVIQPDAVRLVLASLNVPFDVLEDAGKRYRHGKLVEAIRPDGSRWTLTGSPNLSARALLLSASKGGNIEVGVVTEPADSIFAFPEAKAVELSEVPVVRIGSAAAGRTAGEAMLLAAVRVEDGLELVFSKGVAGEVRILTSVHDEFDSWTEAGVVPPGAASHVRTGVNVPGGSRIRSVQAGAGSARGGIVFVTDPRLVMAFPGENSSRGGVTAAGPVDLISDPGLLEKFLAALSQLATLPSGPPHGHATGPAVPRGEDSAAPASTLRLDTAEEDWLAYIDDAKASLGPAMFRFIMAGFPGLRALAAEEDDGGLLTPTDKVVEERSLGLETDDDADAATGDDVKGNGFPAALDRPDEADLDLFRGQTEAGRRRIRRLLTSAVTAAMPKYPAAQRLALLTAVLIAVQAGIWDSPLGERGWIAVLSTALENLDQDHIPEQLIGPLASWAALATYLMHDHRPTTGRSAEVLSYEKAARAVSYLFPAADHQLIAGYAEPFTNKNGYPVDPDAVLHVIEVVVQDDPLTQAIDALEARHPDWRAHKHNDAILHVDGHARNTFLLAAEALDAIPDTARMAAVFATGSTAGWTIAIRCDGTLIHVEKNPQGGFTWQQYRLGNLVTPTRVSRERDLAARARIHNGPLGQHFPAAIEALTATGFGLSDPPSQCPPGASFT
jgi:hypothetical protein